MIVKGKNVSMISGDSEALEVSLKGGSFAKGDVVEFRLRRNRESCCNVMLKTVDEFDDNGKAVIAFEPADTENIAKGSYVYDIKIRWADGNVKTPIEAAQFNIT